MKTWQQTRKLIVHRVTSNNWTWRISILHCTLDMYYIDPLKSAASNQCDKILSWKSIFCQDFGTLDKAASIKYFIILLAKKTSNGETSLKLNFSKTLYPIFAESPSLNEDVKDTQRAKSWVHCMISRERKAIQGFWHQITLCQFGHMNS